MSRMRATCLLAVALLFCAAAFDSPSLYVPGIGLLVLAAAAAGWVRIAARDASIERLADGWSVVEGVPYRLAYRIASGRVRPPRARLVDPLLDEPVELGSATGALAAETRFERRGRVLLAGPTLEVGDPFGLRVRRVRGPDGPEVLVLPRVEEVSVPPAGRFIHGRGLGPGAGPETGLEAEAVDLELDGVRPYRPGTPAARIHWRSVARSGELFEHRMVSGGGANPLVVLDAYEPQSLDALDRAVRAAASLGVELARGGGCNVLLGETPRPLQLDSGLGSWPELHARFALVERTRRPPAVPRGVAAVYWVSAAAEPAAQVRAAGVLSGFLVCPGAAGPRDAFTVAGCRGIDLGLAVAEAAGERVA